MVSAESNDRVEMLDFDGDAVASFVYLGSGTVLTATEKTRKAFFCGVLASIACASA